MALATSADDPIEIESGIRIKEEKESDPLTPTTTNAEKLIEIDPQISELESRDITITVAPSEENSAPTSKSSAQNYTKTSTNNSPKPSSPPPPDYTSRCKAFGWATIGSVHLPFIMRGEHKFVAARILDDKIIGTYTKCFPIDVFKFTQVGSFFMTEAEIILYNEINEFHCDRQFGYQKFTQSDVVVGLEDCKNYYEFLETCKAKFGIEGANHSYSDKCGFLSIKNECVPYLKKEMQKYIPVTGVPAELKSAIENVENITDWDRSYLRLLYGKTVADSLPIEQICCVDDLKKATVGIHFEEVLIDLNFVHISNVPSSNDTLSKWENAVIQSPVTAVENAKKFREKISEMHDKETVLNNFLGFDNYLNINPPYSRTAHLTQNSELQNGLVSISNNGKANMFPMSIDNLLVSSPTHNYPFPISYSNQYNNHLQSQIPDLDRYRKMEESISLAPGRAKPFPPPPPLVRLNGSRSGAVQTDNSMLSKTAIYPYLPPPNPWLSRLFQEDWLREEERLSLQQKDTPENLSRRLSENDLWCPTSLSSSSNFNGAGSSNLVRSNSNPASVLRDGYELTGSSLCRDDRMLHPHAGSPRLLAGSGPPPHYPTPPQSSPLQPLSLMDCATVPAVPDLYATRSTPNGLDLCSPPPSPEIRTALSNSPRGSMSSYAYHPHIARLTQIDSRHVLAINYEPLKYNSMIVVPLSEVVNKFLRGYSIQSCQIMLESYGLQLYDCTSLHHEAFAKHNVTVLPGSKLVLLSDLKNCVQQTQVVLSDREKQKDSNCDYTSSESPSSKRWCNNAREC